MKKKLQSNGALSSLAFDGSRRVPEDVTPRFAVEAREISPTWTVRVRSMLGRFVKRYCVLFTNARLPSEIVVRSSPFVSMIFLARRTPRVALFWRRLAGEVLITLQSV